MENIIMSLDIIYEVEELLGQLNKDDMDSFSREILEQVMEKLDDTRRILYHESNKKLSCCLFL